MKRQISPKMIENLNALGNLLTALGNPSKELDGNKYDSSEIFDRLIADYKQVMEMETDLHDSVNELCYKCGSYREQHLGACNGCRWLEKRQG